MSRFRYISSAVLTAVVIAFAMQNLHAVDVGFLLWDFEASVSMIVLVPFLSGLILGGVTALYYAHRKHGAKSAAAVARPDALPPPADDDAPQLPAGATEASELHIGERRSANEEGSPPPETIMRP